MGIVTALFDKRTNYGPDNDFWYGGLGVKTKTGLEITESNAMTLSAVWACIRAIAETASSIPLNMYQRLPGGGKRKATDNQLHYLLHYQPNPEMTSMQWRESGIAHLLGWGNWYSQIDRSRNNVIMGLWPLRPDRMTVERNRQGVLQYRYKYTDPKDGEEIFDASEILHVAGLGFNGVIGYSVIQMFREAIGMGLALEEFGARFFENNAQPGGIIKLPNALKDEEAVKRLKASWYEAVGTLKNAHKVAVLENGAEWQAMGLPMKDAQFIEGRKFQVEEICRIYRVPPPFIQDHTHSTFCLPGNTPIMTEFGPKAISEIVVGEKVWSNDEGKWVLSSVEKASCTGDDEIFTIHCTNRTLRANGKHRVAVRRKSLTPFKGGRGQTIIQSSGDRYRVNWKTEWVEVKDLKIGDYLLAVDFLLEQNSVSSPTREEVSEEFMEALGMLTGDGFFTRGNGTGSGFGISHAENASFLPHYISAIEHEFEQYSGPYGRTNGGTSPLKAKRRDKNTTVFHSGLAYDELQKLGIIGTARTKRIPTWVFPLKRNLKLAFLRGYLDADGTVNKKGVIRFVSVNKELIQDIRHLCVSAGIQVGNIFSTEIKSSMGAGTHTLYACICSNIHQCLEIGSHTNLYIDRFKSKLSNLRKRECKIHPYETKRTDCGEGLIPTAIEKIERGEKEPVYDLCIKGSHNFIADLLLVHNSNIEHLSIDFVVHTIRPWLVRIEQAIQAKLIPYKSQEEYFAEHVVDGLLRGDIASRYSAYATGRQWGWLSADDIRELENQNPLPEGQGKVYLIPQNMYPADKLDEMVEAQKQKTANPFGNKPKESVNTEESEKSEEEGKRQKLLDTYRPLFEDVSARIVRREKIAVERAMRRNNIEDFQNYLDGFYNELPEFISKNMMPVLRSYESQTGNNSLDERMNEYIAFHLHDSSQEIREFVSLKKSHEPAEFSTFVNSDLATWETMRTQRMAGYMTNRIVLGSS